MTQRIFQALAERCRAFTSLNKKKLLVGLLSVGIVGCANLSVQGLFSHYSAALQQTHSLAAKGEFVQALETLPESVDGDLLDGMERGRLAFLAGDIAQSAAGFEKADRAAKEQQQQAVIQVSEGFNQAGALLTNDNMLTYLPADYELGFLHLYRMLGYLQQGDLTAALVEARRANQVQEEARKLRESELKNATVSAQKNGISDNVGAVLSRYPDAGAMLGAVQNGYLFYLSALLYEAEGNLNSAFIDYSRALAVAPDNQFVAKGAMRVAFKQGRKNDLDLLEQRFGKYQRPLNSQAQLVVINEQGIVNARQAWRLPIWFYDRHGNLESYSLALPYYTSFSARPQTSFRIDGSDVVPEALVNVNAMAQQALNEAMPAMSVRQILRVVAKNEMRKSLSETDESGVGNVVANIFNVLSEQPDTRSWQTLPESVGVYSEMLSAGQHVITVDGQSIEVALQPGKTTLLWQSRQGGKVIHWQGILGGI
ncbi:COG3014 family protein [Enterovibrio sp. 27052020O]|uniref:COG3014 family protein n=1 Tax=Enterovibrio sp. 27052020O TaxID=3241166 RepID=UPI003890FEB3